jgi:hypothetical protein
VFLPPWPSAVSILLSCRENWLSPVIQATGRQEQWDDLRRKNLIASADGFPGPHYGCLHDSGVNSFNSSLQSHLTRQNLEVLLFTKGQRFEAQASTPANIARPCSQYCNVTNKCNKKLQKKFYSVLWRNPSTKNMILNLQLFINFSV